MQVLKRVKVLFLVLLLCGCEQLLPIQSDGVVIRSGFEQHPAATYTVEDVSDNFKTAMLLPLSGKAATYGQGLKNAAMMALEDADNDHLIVRFYDTQSSAIGAESAARQAIADGNRLILGPLTSEEVSAMTPIAQANRIPVISFSTSPNVLQEGVYTLGLLGKEQVERVLTYAVRQNRSKIAVLVPDSVSGLNLAKAAVESATQLNADVVKIGFYPAETMDFTEIVQKMTNGGAGDKPDFDAVLIAESGNRLKSAAAMFGYYDVAYPDVLFMGTSVWENTPLSKETTLYHAVYPVLSRVHGQYFNKKYESLFGELPNSLYSFAYDGVALASALSRKDASQLYQNITDADGYIGLNGVFRIYPDGSNNHSLELVEVTADGLKTLDSAPAKISPSAAGMSERFAYPSVRPRIYGKDASLVYRQLFGY